MVTIFSCRIRESKTIGYRFKVREGKFKEGLEVIFHTQVGVYVDQAARGSSRGEYIYNVLKTSINVHQWERFEI